MLGHSTRKDRHPLSPQELASIFMEINTLLPWDLAFWAAVTLAFRALLRKSHYTYSRHTFRRLGDVSLYPDHIVIRVRSSKTDQFSTREHRIVLNSSPWLNLCPVHWITALARAQNPLESDYLIRVPGNLGLGPLSYPWFNQKLKDLSASLGLDPTTISSHSLRHGGASFMSAQGVICWTYMPEVDGPPLPSLDICTMQMTPSLDRISWCLVTFSDILRICGWVGWPGSGLLDSPTTVSHSCSRSL